jgi:hypothetical protein
MVNLCDGMLTRFIAVPSFIATREATRKRGDCHFAALVRRGTVSTSISRLFTSPAKTRLLRRQRQLALNRSELFLDTIEPAGS